MSALDLFPAAKVDAERSAEECRFNIVRDNCIPSEDHLHVATTYQIRDISTCSCMDDCRAQHEENLAIVGTSLFHLTRDLMNCEYLDLLCRNSALHKSKRLAISSPFKRLNTNTIMPNHDFFANLYFVHWFTKSAMIGLIKHNCDIHLDIFYVYPLSIQAYLSG